MAGRFAYIPVAGAALVGGMYFQGDLDFDDHDAPAVAAVEDRDRDVDRRIDRIVDRETRDIARRGEDGKWANIDPATRRALAAAVAELVRAEGNLVTAKLDDRTPEAVIEQARQRRDRARQAVERLADEARAGAGSDRDALRRSIRDEVRAAVRG